MIEVNVKQEDQIVFSCKGICIKNDLYQIMSKVYFSEITYIDDFNLESCNYLEINIMCKQKTGKIREYLNLSFAPIENIKNKQLSEITVKGLVEYKNFGELYDQLTIDWLSSWEEAEISDRGADNKSAMYDKRYDLIIQKQLETSSHGVLYQKRKKEAYINACSFWEGRNLEFNSGLCTVETNRLVNMVDIYATFAHQFLGERSYIGSHIHAFDDMLTDYHKALPDGVTPHVVIHHKNKPVGYRESKKHRDEINEELALVIKVLKEHNIRVEEKGIPS